DAAVPHAQAEAVLLVVVAFPEGTADADGGHRRLHLVGRLVGLADGTGQRAETADDQRVDAAVAFGIPLVAVLVDAELRVGLEGHDGAVGEAHLRRAARTGDQGVTAVHRATTRQRALLAGGIHRLHVAEGDQHGA